MTDQPTNKGMGRFGKGCLVAVVAAIVLTVAGGIGGWWIYGRIVDAFTSDHRDNLTMDEPDTVTVRHAEAKLRELRSAVSNKSGTTIEFSAADLNTMVARDPAFVGVRGKMRVNMSGSEMIIDLTTSLNDTPLPKLKGRWFNGQARLGFVYDRGQFSFDAHSFETKGHRIEKAAGSRFTSSFLQSFSSSFTRRFNEGFQKGQARSLQGHAFWDQIKSMSVRNGNLDVATRDGT